MNQFRIFSGLLKAYEDDGTKTIHTTASSTVKDHSGDEITATALAKMAARANKNLTIFLNHEYRVPEDVFGSVKMASVAQRGQDGAGNAIWDLDLDIALNEENPRAVQTYNAIKSGTQLGTSIGAIIRHATKKKEGGHVIDDLDLMEASIVSIPANPRSWVQYAMKSLAGSDADAAVIEDEAIEKSAGTHGHAHTHSHPHEHGWEGSADHTLHDHDHAHRHSHEHDDGHAHEDDMNDWQHDHDHAGDHTDEHAHGDGSDATAKAAAPQLNASTTITTPSAAPTKTDATVVVEVDGKGTVWVDDSPKPQEAPADPETGVLDETAPGDDAALADGQTKAAEGTIDKVASVDTADLGAVLKAFSGAMAQIATLQKSLTSAEAERDEARENLDAAKAIVLRMAKLPVGPKASYRKAATEMTQKFGGVYSEEFLQFLEK